MPMSQSYSSKRWSFLFVIVLLIAFAVRLYKLNSPLWLDELYGYRLAKLGFEAIIQNSWIDPHPPLFNILQWAIGLEKYQNEILWRLIPLSSGMLTIVFIGIITKETINPFASIVICLTAATLPSLVFYSQEARPFALLIFLASLSMWLTITIIRNPLVHRLWIGWTVVSLLGLFTGYAYLMVAFSQLAFLGLYNYRRAHWWIVLVIIISGWGNFKKHKIFRLYFKKK